MLRRCQKLRVRREHSGQMDPLPRLVGHLSLKTAGEPAQWQVSSAPAPTRRQPPSSSRVLRDPLGLLLGLDGGEVLVTQACRAPAVDDELRTSRVAGLVADQLDDEAGNFSGLGGTPQCGLEESSGTHSVIGVLINPGWTELTRIPLGPNSKAVDFVRPRTANLVAV